MEQRGGGAAIWRCRSLLTTFNLVVPVWMMDIVGRSAVAVAFQGKQPQRMALPRDAGRQSRSSPSRLCGAASTPAPCPPSSLALPSGRLFSLNFPSPFSLSLSRSLALSPPHSKPIHTHRSQAQAARRLRRRRMGWGVGGGSPLTHIPFLTFLWLSVLTRECHNRMPLAPSRWVSGTREGGWRGSIGRAALEGGIEKHGETLDSPRWSGTHRVGNTLLGASTRPGRKP